MTSLPRTCRPLPGTRGRRGPGPRCPAGDPALGSAGRWVGAAGKSAMRWHRGGWSGWKTPPFCWPPSWSAMWSRHARHGGSDLELRIADTGAWLRIEVVDADPRPPAAPSPAELDESGFGLVLVEALASKWGVDQAAEGKTVWIELDTRRSGDLDRSSSGTRQLTAMGWAAASQPGQHRVVTVAA